MYNHPSSMILVKIEKKNTNIIVNTHNLLYFFII